MNWFKENKVPAGILGAGVALFLAGAWLAWDASGREAAAKERLAGETNRIQSLRRSQPPPNPDGFRQAKAELDEYKTETANLARSLAAKEEPLEDISPESFQDKIRQAADSISAKAASNKVALPAPFLLGFEKFQSQLPPPDQTASLYREFKVVDRLLNSILGPGIEKIDLLERGRPGAENAARPEEPAPRQPPQADEKVPPPMAVHPIRLAFTGKQEAVIGAINLVPADSQFLVIRSLVLENTVPAPPVRGAEGGPAAIPSPAPATPGLAAQGKLEVVLGRESVKATLDLELLDFPKPPED
jgi:hypothetical protein